MELTILLVFASVAALTVAFGSATTGSASRRRLAKLSTALGQAGSSAVAGRKSGRTADASKTALMRVLTPLARVAPGQNASGERLVRQRLVYAGYRNPSAVVVYYGTRIALALLIPIATLLSQVILDVSETRLTLTLIAGAGIGYIAPSFWLDRRVKARQRLILRGLPDALDLMVVCVEAGLGINAALARVAREFARTNPTLNEELELVTLQIRAGKSLTESLRAFSERTGLTEVSALVAMLVQTEQFGTSVANALRIHADGVRVARMQAAEELAAKAPVKMLFPTLLIFAATLIVVLGPGFIQLMAVFRSHQQ